MEPITDSFRKTSYGMAVIYSEFPGMIVPFPMDVYDRSEAQTEVDRINNTTVDQAYLIERTEVSTSKQVIRYTDDQGEEKEMSLPPNLMMVTYRALQSVGNVKGLRIVNKTVTTTEDIYIDI